MSYKPDITRYQQLVYGGITGKYDCTAWAGAIVTDAHSRGAYKLSGRAIRLASSEPIPDPASPGLNDEQVDAAIYKLTRGAVNLNTTRPSRQTVVDRCRDGYWVSLAVDRGVLVDRGYGGSSRSRVKHRISVHARDTDGAPVIGDPLVPYYYAATWDAILDAAQRTTASGTIFASFSRDTTPDYRVSILPEAGHDRAAFFRYTVSNGIVTGRTRRYTGGFSAVCTPPLWKPVAPGAGFVARRLVQVKDKGSAYNGWWLDGRYAKEVLP